MKKTFLIKLIAILLPFIFLFIYAEYRLKNLDTAYSLKYKELIKKDDTQLLIFGSSHTYRGLNPSLMSLKGYNLANFSQSLYYDKELFFRALSSKTNLKYIVIPISYSTLWGDLHESKEAWREYHYYKFMGIRAPKLDTLNLAANSYVALYSLGKVQNYFFRGFKVNLTDDMNEYGWAGRKSRAGDVNAITEETGRKRVVYHSYNMKTSQGARYFKINSQILEDMVAKARKEGIEVVLISTPLYKTYREAMDKEIYKKNQQVIQQIKSKYGAKFYDYSADSRFTIEDFYDHDHLNSKGAEKFSYILDKSITAFQQ